MKCQESIEGLAQNRLTISPLLQGHCELFVTPFYYTVLYLLSLIAVSTPSPCVAESPTDHAQMLPLPLSAASSAFAGAIPSSRGFYWEVAHGGHRAACRGIVRSHTCMGWPLSVSPGLHHHSRTSAPRRHRWHDGCRTPGAGEAGRAAPGYHARAYILRHVLFRVVFWAWCT